MYTVKKGVTLTEATNYRGGAPRKYPFDTMQVDEIFFVPGKTTDQMAGYASRKGRELGRKFSTRTVTMRQDLQTDEWEPCAAGALGSKEGVAVCRTE